MREQLSCKVKTSFSPLMLLEIYNSILLDHYALKTKKPHISVKLLYPERDLNPHGREAIPMLSGRVYQFLDFIF